jgi:hypothetical protein
MLHFVRRSSPILRSSPGPARQALFTFLAWPGHVLLPANAAPNIRILVAVRVGGLPAARCAKLVAANLELVQRLGLHANRALSISGGRHRTHLFYCKECAVCAARSEVGAETPFRRRCAARCTFFHGASPAPTGWTVRVSNPFHVVLSMAAHARLVRMVVLGFRVRGWVITFAIALLKAVSKARVLQAYFGNLRHVGRELCAGSCHGCGVPTILAFRASQRKTGHETALRHRTETSTTPHFVRQVAGTASRKDR